MPVLTGIPRSRRFEMATGRLIDEPWSPAMTLLFTAEATAIGGRQGYAETSDGALRVKLGIPEAVGGPGDRGVTNPEQLFAMGYAAGFGSAIDYAAHLQGVALATVRVHAKVHIVRRDNGGFELAVELAANLAGVDRDDARQLLQTAHAVCLYSRATRENIVVTIRVDGVET